MSSKLTIYRGPPGSLKTTSWERSAERQAAPSRLEAVGCSAHS